MAGFIPLSPRSPTQCRNQLSYLPTQHTVKRRDKLIHIILLRKEKKFSHLLYVILELFTYSLPINLKKVVI